MANAESLKGVSNNIHNKHQELAQRHKSQIARNIEDAKTSKLKSTVRYKVDPGVLPMYVQWLKENIPQFLLKNTGVSAARQIKGTKEGGKC